MEVGVIGLNHKCADLNLREKILAATQQKLGPSSLSNIVDSHIVLLTCNRVEIYFASQDLSRAHTFLLNSLRHVLKFPFEHKLYSYFRWDCFTHLSHVASGLDSAVIAETEIQGQVKNAYLQAQEKSLLHPDLHFLFQKSLKIGKGIRTQFFKDKGAPSLEATLYQLIKSQSFESKQPHILFVGASVINQSIIKDFKQRGLKNLHLSNRSLQKGQAIAEKEGIKALPWCQPSHWLNDYQVLIFATKCPYFLLKYEEGRSYEGRRLLLDLSVPRDIDTHFQKVKDYELLNMDQVNRLVRHKSELKKGQIQEAKKAISEAIHRVIGAYKKKKQASLIYQPMLLAT